MTPELAKHLLRMQTFAMQAALQVDALDSVIDYPERKDIVLCLISNIREIIGDVRAGLEDVNLPKGGEA